MASTNKTTNYELSQYIGTDKPTYLTDYNQDMSKIDAGIHAAKSEADQNATDIGTLSSLTTDSKTNLVAAINEVDDHADTNAGNIATNTSNIATNTTHIGTLANLTTASKTDLVVAANEINAKVGNISNLETDTKTSTVAAINEVNSLINKLNITHYDTYDINSITSSGVSNITGSVTVATNDDGSVFKIYTSQLITNATQSAASITFNTRIRPDTNITINGAGIKMFQGEGGSYVWFSGIDLNIATNGNVTISVGKSFGNETRQYMVLSPCLYFAKDFGDVPTPTP